MTTFKCKRCKETDATLKSRKELFCDACFIKFVSMKQRKLMMVDEFYRDHFKVLYGKDLVDDGRSKILVPFDFSSSSLSALDVLLGLLKEQNIQHRGRVGFTLELLTVFKSDEDRINIENMWKELRSSPLYDENAWGFVNYHMVNANNFFESAKELQHIVLHDQDFTTKAIEWRNESDGEYSIQTLLDRCPNRNTRNDMWIFIVKHIVKKFTYQQENIKVILWCQSMTKMADQIIGLVVKGRGAQIASSLDSENADAEYGDRFKNLYPLKNTLLSQLDAYCIIRGLDKYTLNYEVKSDLFLNAADTDTSDTKTKNIRLVKNMTINELARKYFDDIEGEYSNIISTVLRTGDKLKPPKIETSSTENHHGSSKCAICLNTIYDDPAEWLRNIAVNRGHPVETEEEQSYYDQWKASKIGLQNEEYLTLRNRAWDNGNDIDLCYGCTINLNGIKTKELVWPKNDSEELQSVLAEYEL